MCSRTKYLSKIEQNIYEEQSTFQQNKVTKKHLLFLLKFAQTLGKLLLNFAQQKFTKQKRIEQNFPDCVKLRKSF